VFVDLDDPTVIYYSPRTGRIANVTNDQIIDLYDNYNFGISFLSKIIERTTKQIKQLLIDRGIRLRTFVEGRKFHNVHNVSRKKMRDAVAAYFGIKVPSTLGQKSVILPRLNSKSNSRKKTPEPTLNLGEPESVVEEIETPENEADIENGTKGLTESLQSYTTDDDLIAMLYVLGYSARAIGRAIGLNGKAVTRKLRKQKVEIRSHKEAATDIRKVPRKVLEKFAI